MNDFNNRNGNCRDAVEKTPENPRIGMGVNGIPYEGTSVDSNLLSLPIHCTCKSLPNRSFKHSYTASAGVICPPVPPAAMSSLNCSAFFFTFTK